MWCTFVHWVQYKTFSRANIMHRTLVSRFRALWLLSLSWGAIWLCSFTRCGVVGDWQTNEQSKYLANRLGIFLCYASKCLNGLSIAASDANVSFFTRIYFPSVLGLCRSSYSFYLLLLLHLTLFLLPLSLFFFLFPNWLSWNSFLRPLSLSLCFIRIMAKLSQ